MSNTHRVGLIVPSSNTTMETEIPTMLRRHRGDHSFTFHSSRMPMRRVSPEELARMDAESARCARELSDARCDVLAYACLVAIMATGPNYHVASEQHLGRVAAENGGPAPVVTSAGALIDGIRALGAERVAMITPYRRPLTRLVVEYLEAADIEVVEAVSLEVEDNLAVGRLDPHDLLDIAAGLPLGRCDALVLAACVQLPSLPAIEPAERRFGLPVLSTAVATTWAILNQLGLEPRVDDAGALLAGAGQPAPHR
jgi:maleate isomerase